MNKASGSSSFVPRIKALRSSIITQGKGEQNRERNVRMAQILYHAGNLRYGIITKCTEGEQSRKRTVVRWAQILSRTERIYTSYFMNITPFRTSRGFYLSFPILCVFFSNSLRFFLKHWPAYENIITHTQIFMNCHFIESSSVRLSSLTGISPKAMRCSV